MTESFQTVIREIQPDFQSQSTRLPQLHTSVAKEIEKASAGTQRHLLSENPYREYEEILKQKEAAYPASKHHKSSCESCLEPLDEFLSAAKLPGFSYWSKEIGELKNKSNSDAELTHLHLLQHWRKQYDQVSAEWELNVINSYRQALLKRLKEWLKLIKELADTIEELGLDPGYFISFDKGQMSLGDLEQLKKWLDYIAKDEGIRRLCELLGRLRQASSSEKLETVERTIAYENSEIDVDSREEIVGIRLGKDLEHILPSELALLSDPETSILFDLKYTENRLMCFDLIGMQSLTEEMTVEEEQSTEIEDKKGPIVICVDTSGSMHGSPETIAKALTLFLASEAKKDDRNCYLINFSTGIETLDLSDGYAFSTLLEFLRKSFHGGTDITPAIDHSIEVMQQDDYENADLLVISDFVMSELAEETMAEMEQLKESGNRFYSLCIGNAFMSQRMESVFDQEWIYNPRTTGVTELIHFQKDLAKNMHQQPEAVGS